MHGRVLAIAGSDSSGGAGIQADIKTVTVLGGYAAAAITAVTAQNTMGVHAIRPLEPSFVAQQISVVLSDIGADCIKTGMLYSEAIVAAVCDVLATEANTIPLVVDPVMIAKGGQTLLTEAALAALKTRLLPRTTVFTPNIPEAETLLGYSIPDYHAMQDAARALCAMGPHTVLLKGGHLSVGNTVYDILATPGATEIFAHERVATRHTHGTGCTLASAIAAGIAFGLNIHQAVSKARQYVYEAILHSPGLGAGKGPLGHNFKLHGMIIG